MTRPSIKPYLEVRYAQRPSFSASGRRMAFLYDGPGCPQVYMLQLDPEDDPDQARSWNRWPHQLTFEEDRVTFCEFLPGSESRILYGQDRGGDEREEIRLLDADSGHEEVLAPPEGHLNVFGAASRDGTRIAYAANARVPEHFDIVIHDLETGERRTCWELEGWNRAVAFSSDGATLYVQRFRSNLECSLWALPLEGRGDPRCLVGEEAHLVTALSVHPGNGELFVAEDQGSDRLHLSRIDPETGERAELADHGWDIEETAVNPQGMSVAYTVNREGISQLWVRHLVSGGGQRLEGVPVGVITDLHFSPDGRRLAFTLSGDRFPTSVWIAPLTGRAFRATAAPQGKLDRSLLGSSRLHRFPSFDGLEVPCWLCGDGEKAVVLVHGGPEGQARPRFHPLAQYLVGRGFRVFQPNVRGSAGYGRHYLSLDDRRKRADAVRDLASLHDWIRDRELADPDHVALVGGSYGGFMVLAGLTEFPDRWRCGVDLVGISNFRTFLENTGAYRRRMREAEYGSLEEDGEFLDSISPIHKVDRIACPLLVGHGANDPRVPLEEAEQIVAALEARGIPHDFMVFGDEGHGVARRANRVTLYTRIAAFLEEHL